jgi:hypothetical protein
MTTIIEGGDKDLAMWSKIGEGLFIQVPTVNQLRILNWWLHYHLGDATTEDIKTLLQPYGTVLDYPAAMNGPELYSTYPDAKYILVRYHLIPRNGTHRMSRPQEILKNGKSS